MPERGHHHDGAVEDWRICLLPVGPSSFRLFVLPGIDEGCLNKKIPALFYRGQEFFYWGDEPADSMMEKIFRPILRTLPSSFLGKEPNHVVTFPRAVISTEVEKSPFSIAQAASGPEISRLRVSIRLDTFAPISTCSSARDDNSQNRVLSF